MTCRFLVDSSVMEERLKLVRRLISECPDTTVRISDEKLDEIWNGLKLGEF